MQQGVRQDIRGQDIRQDLRPDTRSDTKTSKENVIKDLVKGFMGRDIVITLRSKKALKGKLESMTQYELLLTIAQEPVIVMKHAIEYIEVSK